MAVQLYFKAVADPDLQIRGRGGGGGGCHPDPEISGGGTGDCLQKNVFSVHWAPVWSKNKGVPVAPGYLPLDLLLV